MKITKFKDFSIIMKPPYSNWTVNTLLHKQIIRQKNPFLNNFRDKICINTNLTLLTSNYYYYYYYLY